VWIVKTGLSNNGEGISPSEIRERPLAVVAPGSEDGTLQVAPLV
jgi:hypothetical protein